MLLKSQINQSRAEWDRLSYPDFHESHRRTMHGHGLVSAAKVWPNISNRKITFKAFFRG